MLKITASILTTAPTPKALSWKQVTEQQGLYKATAAGFESIRFASNDKGEVIFINSKTCEVAEAPIWKHCWFVPVQEKITVTFDSTK